VRIWINNSRETECRLFTSNDHCEVVKRALVGWNIKICADCHERTMYNSFKIKLNDSVTKPSQWKFSRTTTEFVLTAGVLRGC
jgi:hypothetical protein